MKEFDRRENVVRASLSDRAAVDVCFPHVICELPLYQYFFLSNIFFMSYVPLTFLLCMLFSVILQCGGESSNANAHCDNDSDDHHAFDPDIASDRPLSPVVDAARENIVDEGVTEKV